MKSFNLTLFLHTSVVVALTDLAAAAVCVLLTLHLGAALGLVGVADMQEADESTFLQIRTNTNIMIVKSH